jgi:hypothetical protein
LWTIAAARTKSQREHALPLSLIAVQTVEEAIKVGNEA